MKVQDSGFRVRGAGCRVPRQVRMPRHFTSSQKIVQVTGQVTKAEETFGRGGVDFLHPKP